MESTTNNLHLIIITVFKSLYNKWINSDLKFFTFVFCYSKKFKLNDYLFVVVMLTDYY